MTAVLGIETSCDETGVAVVEDGFRIAANHVVSQMDVHAEFGGVVPEIASRCHIEIIAQLVGKVLHEYPAEIDVVAATQGPGLMGSLFVGLSFAKALAYARGLPFIPVNHIEGHIYSAFLGVGPPQFPALALIVSGGHTSLIRCPGAHVYQVVGSTRDDAVGESFDKVARLLGLSYPGGPSIEREALGGNPEAIAFPRAMAKSKDLAFSYSGLKTAVLYEVQRNPEGDKADLSASFQAAAVDVLLIKTKRALLEFPAPRLILAGGVAANKLLRERLHNELDLPVLMPPLDLCVDNGAMIAAAGYGRFKAGHVGDMRATPDPSLAL